jgi:putative copper resistance protein D
VLQLLSIFSYFSVVIRGLSLVLQTLLVGSTAFIFLVLRPSCLGIEESRAIETKIRRVLFWTACSLALVQTLYALINCSILMSTTGLRFREVVGAQFLIASGLTIVACITLVIIVHFRISLWASLAPVAAILLASVATTHAWSRVESRYVLSVFDFTHQTAVGIWIGGLPCLLIALSGERNPDSSASIAKNFSRTAVIAVVVVLIAGLALSISYLDKANALYGTAYGIMLLSKGALFLVLLGIGAMNKSIVERLPAACSRLVKVLRRNVEAEIGIGLTVVMVAASLTSQPPAIDLQNDRLTLTEIQSRFAPRWPKLSSPDVSQLNVPDQQILAREAERTGRPTSYVPGSGSLQPESREGKAWSEYNHNWAGIVILAVGLLAVLSHASNIRWTRNWPLLFIGLAMFILLRADPENWPLGPNGFWQSCLVADVLQHRFFALLIVGFAIFEWRVQTGRCPRGAHSFVFPAVCALGGALLFTHSHSLGNIKDETLIEWSHMALAVLAVIAGWSRWVELRSSSRTGNALALIWSLCFAMIGTVLILYRES